MVCGTYIHYPTFYQWPFQEPNLEVLTIYEAYTRPMWENIPTKYGLMESLHGANSWRQIHRQGSKKPSRHSQRKVPSSSMRRLLSVSWHRWSKVPLECRSVMCLLVCSYLLNYIYIINTYIIYIYISIIKLISWYDIWWISSNYIYMVNIN